MSFIRVRTIKGKKYRYLETRWREGRRVRSRSQYLGAAGVPDHGIGQFGLEKLDAGRVEAERAERATTEAGLAELHDKYGLKMPADNPVPEEKAPANVAEAQTTQISSPETAPHSPDGTGEGDAPQ